MKTTRALIDKLIEMASDDDYLAVGAKITKHKRVALNNNNFVMCSFLHPDSEEISFPTQINDGTRRPQECFKNFEAWIDGTLETALHPTAGDGCLYQAGWTAVLADDKHIYTVEFHYWERTADEEEERYQRLRETIDQLSPPVR